MIDITTLLAILVPLFIASSGELILQRTGIVNLGIEGIMVLGAFIGWYIAAISNNNVLAILAILFISLLLAVFFWVLIDILEIRQHIVGLGVGFLCTGISLTSFRLISEETRDISIYIETSVVMILLAALFITIAALLITYFLIGKKKMYQWKLTGESLRGADLLGVQIKKIRLVCTSLAIMTAMIAGYILAVVVANKFTMGIVSGRGWISICLVILARWDIRYLLLACFGWSIIEIVALQTQVGGVNTSYHLTLMLPYLVCIIFVALSGSGGAMPKMLLNKYNRNEDAS